MKSCSRMKIKMPCAGCKLLRRRCTKDCIFVPYFPATDPEKFAGVHRIFGASNVSKMLRDIPVNQRGDAVCSMVYEAHARLKDPIYGCVAAIVSLQHQVSILQAELAMTNADNMSLKAQLSDALSALSHASPRAMDHVQGKMCTITQLSDALTIFARASTRAAMDTEHANTYSFSTALDHGYLEQPTSSLPHLLDCAELL
ncbi:hypothetical protein AMTRI_Chr07g79040 [Amborella trichopoda]|uniref:LOB domain-containing protein n=1 Tax=Amborella trichopoda TaxID=13333 RepID=W1PAS4_AMBTC|nr:LOB domain-containing protein 4 [Amborella trichopoda]ERN04676.1 hypothetical protein AMTR_s00076p00127530 [Amborella trichopoda]|eukprot:XP_020522059.1 LOB domain-containing protein 4 [Amborella trichopoda]